jgi:hypothetical protein
MTPLNSFLKNVPQPNPGEAALPFPVLSLYDVEE